MLSRKNFFYDPLFLLLVFVLFFMASIGSASLSTASIQAQTGGARKTKIFDRAKASVVVKEVRNLENEDWLSSLEVEVQNNSNKPIYHLFIILIFPDLPGQRSVIPLVYGRRDLMKSGQFATSDDVPIRPGQKHVFSVHKSFVDGFRLHLSQINFPESEIKTITIEIDSLSFGDGTGFDVGKPFSKSRISKPIQQSQKGDVFLLKQ